MMHISTKKGDSGYTSLLRGQRIPKDHLVTEALGTLDEANSYLGLARSASKTRRIKRIVLQVQKHLFIMGAELSVPKGMGHPPKNRISESNIAWLNRLLEEYEEALALPPGFVAFGQEKSASYMDVARTSVRKVERIVVTMNNCAMIENPFILKYLNRLSDLIFVLACYEEGDEEQMRKISRKLFYLQFADPVFRKWMIFTGSIIVVFIIVIVTILLFHGQSDQQDPVKIHIQEMGKMHQ